MRPQSSATQLQGASGRGRGSAPHPSFSSLQRTPAPGTASARCTATAPPGWLLGRVRCTSNSGDRAPRAARNVHFRGGQAATSARALHARTAGGQGPPPTHPTPCAALHRCCCCCYPAPSRRIRHAGASSPHRTTPHTEPEPHLHPASPGRALALARPYSRSQLPASRGPPVHARRAHTQISQARELALGSRVRRCAREARPPRFGRSARSPPPAGTIQETGDGTQSSGSRQGGWTAEARTRAARESRGREMPPSPPPSPSPSPLGLRP